MNNFKLEIVPPFEYCKRIPAEMFPNSVLVYRGWGLDGDRLDFRARVVNPHEEYIVPAPTLAEIMNDLPRPTLDGYGCIRKWISLQSNPKNEEWIIMYHNEDILYSDINPATAAIRMWMRINSKDYKENEVNK